MGMGLCPTRASRPREPRYDVTVKKDSLLVHVLKFFEILVGWYGSVVVRERD